MNFNDLRSFNIARQKEWNPENKLTTLYFSNALASETGNVCNVVKKRERELADLRGSRSSVTDLADELADVIIYADLLAESAGIDLGEAVKQKFNKTSTKYNLSVRIP